MTTSHRAGGWVLIMLCAVAFGSGCASSHSSATQATQPAVQTITPQIAGKYAVYAMMSANAYHSNKRLRFPIEMLGWQQVYAPKQPTTGPTTKHSFSSLAYDIWYNEK